VHTTVPGAPHELTRCAPSTRYTKFSTLQPTSVSSNRFSPLAFSIVALYGMPSGAKESPRLISVALHEPANSVGFIVEEWHAPSRKISGIASAHLMIANA
jgi:hypothetical protein